MKTINFKPIGKALRVFDTDLMDIGRRQVIENPDGTTGETNPQEPLYTDIPCHISFISSDNPNPEPNDVIPVITGLQINCDLSVDIQNGDYIVAKKMDNDKKTVLETYYGVVGFPEVTQSRKSTIMQMRTDI